MNLTSTANAKAGNFMFRRGVNFLREDFVGNALTLLGNFEEAAEADETVNKLVQGLKKGFSKPDNPWIAFFERVVRDTDIDIMEKLIAPVKNVLFDSFETRKKAMKEHDCNVPWTVLIDPTAACNLKCEGCWSAEYSKAHQLSYDDLNKIIKEGRELGVYFYLYTGGEPLMRKDDLIRICGENPDCLFLAFTNGTLCDDAFADELVRVGNMFVTFSIEGNEETTDARRGKGVYKTVLAAMARLKARGLPFGTSICYTKENVDVIATDEYADFLIDQGVIFSWFFTYVPVGAGAPANLMVTAEQREKMYDQVRKWRREKPFFPIDFFNDGEFVHGCVAAGKQYFHISSNGDCEPCVFAHYSNVNIKEASFIDALQSPVFKAYRNRQPFTDNHLRPCPVLDSPGALKKVVELSGAKSTDLANPETAEDIFNKSVDVAKKWKETADRMTDKYGQLQRSSRSIEMYADFEAGRVRDFEEFE
ncbi:MAG: radical SAM protein [Oscillospiraceae bacterium]|nr:radical SAM protein [Oscillospiraceae bacterium]